jgi:diguanylate cyclase (GGDEF)-like protein
MNQLASLKSVFQTATRSASQSPLKKVSAMTASAQALEAAANFGQWWIDLEYTHIALSGAAAQYLSVEPGIHGGWDGCLTAVVQEDLLPLIAYLTAVQPASNSIEYRVLSPLDGLHWLRMTRLAVDPIHPEIVRGILEDITPGVHASMRERLGFELTEFLVGSHSLGDSITNVIQLICKTLGWDWGAYWAVDPLQQGQPQLSCQYLWHHPELNLASFEEESAKLRFGAGQGLVGSVWAKSEPDWVEDMANDLRFAQRTNDRECKLWSGYAFPVTYVSETGNSHSPGVLEFYSSLKRQPQAQLPKLSKMIGALIAQMARRLDQQAKILHLAQVDGLTGLANRSHFHSLLNQACTVAEKTEGRLHLIFIDLDRFKPINDAFGHEAGNIVLCEFAQRLRSITPGHACVGRLGGDEFAVQCAGDTSADIAVMVGRIEQAARTPFYYEGAELTVSASIGVSAFGDNGRSSPALLQSADAAMYRIKNNGRNGSSFATESSPNALAQQQSTMAQRLALETELHHALQENSFSVVYQPIVDIANDRLHSIEALVRWRRADGSMVAPDIFIPIAEQSHLIVQIGKWVLARVCRDLATLREANFQSLNVHVNMAASEFANSGLPNELLAQLAAFNLAPSCLTLELTEGMLMKRPDQVIPVMRALRRLNFGISLDDFGMGHSSLSLLKNLPITSLKVDRSFVRDLQAQGHDRAIVKTIVSLGQQMGLSVIAEGIETAGQLDVLQQCQCHLIQGYLLARPMELDALIQKYTAH